MKQRIKKKLAWLIALCMLAICLPLSIAMTEGEAASGAASPSEPEETDFSSKTRAIPPSSIDFEQEDPVQVIKKGDVIVANKEDDVTLLVWSCEKVSDEDFREQGILDLAAGIDPSIKQVTQCAYAFGEVDFDMNDEIGSDVWGTYSFRLDEQTGEVTLTCDKDKVSHIDYVVSKGAFNPDYTETPKPEDTR